MDVYRIATRGDNCLVSQFNRKSGRPTPRPRDTDHVIRQFHVWLPVRQPISRLYKLCSILAGLLPLLPLLVVVFCGRSSYRICPCDQVSSICTMLYRDCSASEAVIAGCNQQACSRASATPICDSPFPAVHIQHRLGIYWKQVTVHYIHRASWWFVLMAQVDNSIMLAMYKLPYSYYYCCYHYNIMYLLIKKPPVTGTLYSWWNANKVLHWIE